MLSVSGGDSLTIEVKFKDAVSTVLPARIMIRTNELPQLKDASGALVNRLLLLAMTESFLGKEDVNLKDELKKELPGILRWAVEGWVRLRERGKFFEPKSAADLRDRLMGITSPVKAFLEECCNVAPTASVVCGELYKAHRKWLKGHGHDYMPTAEIFGRDLAAAIPGLQRFQERDGEKRHWMYRGVALCP
jgi:putative DNA primase/helicase